ncbi:uncharacterized protein LOC122243622 [Penaeus japonicus]|uniref:uncharacterized protein LOC122243622 n=1 Tax=Penaeus japonicus TaxID=27405 RepID=UPI001C713B45|nr:uncharacterized protein LOC122243622 [Penaeus japonicus]
MTPRGSDDTIFAGAPLRNPQCMRQASNRIFPQTQSRRRERHVDRLPGPSNAPVNASLALSRRGIPLPCEGRSPARESDVEQRQALVRVVWPAILCELAVGFGNVYGGCRRGGAARARRGFIAPAAWLPVVWLLRDFGAVKDMCEVELRSSKTQRSANAVTVCQNADCI